MACRGRGLASRRAWPSCSLPDPAPSLAPSLPPFHLPPSPTAGPGRATTFVRCEPCVGADPAFARAVLATYGSALRVPADAAVDPAAAERVRAAIARQGAQGPPRAPPPVAVGRVGGRQSGAVAAAEGRLGYR